MNFSKCCKCESNKDVVYFHSDEIEVMCYECLKDYVKDYEGIEIKEDDIGKKLYCLDDIVEENVVKFINKVNDIYSNNTAVAELYFCELCADESNKIMFIVVDTNEEEELTICPKCFAKLNEIDEELEEETILECCSDLDIELVEEPMIQTELTSFWTRPPKYYKVVNRTYNNIESEI